MCDKCGCSEVGKQKTLEEKVQKVIESIRPALQGHGGDVELVGVDSDNTVKIRLQGTCQGCPGATMTMKMGIERILKERVPEVKEVVAVR
jgi:Fe-S cluster biogenesis protein NfuA